MPSIYGCRVSAIYLKDFVVKERLEPKFHVSINEWIQLGRVNHLLPFRRKTKESDDWGPWTAYPTRPKR